MGHALTTAKLPALQSEASRRIARDAIQDRLARLQVRKSLSSGGRGERRECDAAINAMLDLLGDLCGISAVNDE